jgi:hypothetical protein
MIPLDAIFIWYGAGGIGVIMGLIIAPIVWPRLNAININNPFFQDGDPLQP